MTHGVGQSRPEVLPDGHRQPATAPPVGVPLRRLLSLATLTPAQAGHLALAALETTGQDDGRPWPPTARDIWIGSDGAVRVRPADEPSGDDPAALLTELARNADRPAARHRPSSAALLTALTRAAGYVAEDDLPAARGALRAALDAEDADQQHELAALVTTLLARGRADQLAPPAPEREVPPATPPTVVPPPAPVPAGRSPFARRPVWVAAAVGAVVVLAGAGVAFAVALPGGGHHTPAARTTTSTPPTQPSVTTTPSPVLRAVPSFGPAAAGPVAAVTLRPQGTCHAGATCTATVTVQLRPPSLTHLTWHAVAVDRCTGKHTTLDRGTMIAEPSWTSIYATVQLALPDTSALAVVATVDTPVSAASAPLLVPASGGTCTGQ